MFALVTAWAVASATGCATYTDKMMGVRLSAGRGDYSAALSGVDGLLGVSTPDQLPSSLRGDAPLLLLDRGILQQATTRFAGSQKDLSTAEQKLELLDLSKNGIATLGSYLYSDSVKTYRTPPTERLSVNAFNLLNYVALGDLSGAAVEARRFQVMRQYLDTTDQDAPAPSRLGAYLAGFVFEQSGEGDRALRYYDEALAGGSLSSLVEPVQRLAQRNPFRGKNLAGILAKRGDKVSTKPAELLIVVSLGRVPHKIPARMPVGAAVGAAAAVMGDQNLTVLQYSATKVLVYPGLVATPSRAGEPAVAVNGREVKLETLANLGTTIAREYEAAKPQILAAALTRMIARAAVSEGARVAGKQEGDALSILLPILVEATLVALDKPDTRSWTMLPDRVLVARVPVSPGDQEVNVSFRGGAPRIVRVKVAPQGWAAVVVTEPR